MIRRNRFEQGVELSPTNIEGIGGTDLTREGEIDVDSDDSRLKVRVEAATRTVVTEDQTQTLTNKTINVDNNTVSNIETDNLKVGVLNISTTLAGASDTQVPSALAVKSYSDTVSTNLANHLSDATDAHAASAITNTPSGNLAATEVQAALNELQGDIDTNATAISNHLSDATDAHDASAISNSPLGNLASTDVQSALNELQGDINTNTTAIGNHLSDAIDAHDASAISNVPSGNLAATEVQAALNELQSDIDTRFISPMTTGGDLIYGGASGVGTRLSNGAAGQVLISSGGTAAPTWAASPSAPVSFTSINNLSFVTSVSANALTIAIKDAAGVDPSAPTTAIGFRSSTATSGEFVTRTITSALSITISSGSTLGHTNGVAKNIWLYALDNAGTVELAVSSNIFNDSFLHSTTTEGGAGGADSVSVLYSTTTRTNVAIRLIGRLLSSQTTAGVWAVVPTNVALHDYEPVFVAAKYNSSSGQSIPNATRTIVDFSTKEYDSHNSVTTGASWKFTAPISATYRVSFSISIASVSWSSNNIVLIELVKNGTIIHGYDQVIQASYTGSYTTIPIITTVKLLVGDYIHGSAYQNKGSSTPLVADSRVNHIEIEMVGDY
jgi:hypothetical protein